MSACICIKPSQAYHSNLKRITEGNCPSILSSPYLATRLRLCHAEFFITAKPRIEPRALQAKRLLRRHAFRKAGSAPSPGLVSIEHRLKMEDDRDLVDRVHDLSDLELAILLSLVSREHCVIGTPESAVDSLVDEVELVSETKMVPNGGGASG